MAVTRRLMAGLWFGRVLVALMSVSLIGGAALALRASQAAPHTVAAGAATISV